jgi:hypothetical protein
VLLSRRDGATLFIVKSLARLSLKVSLVTLGEDVKLLILYAFNNWEDIWRPWPSVDVADTSRSSCIKSCGPVLQPCDVNR